MTNIKTIALCLYILLSMNVYAQKENSTFNDIYNLIEQKKFL